MGAALRWFGSQTCRWNIISQLFLPHRAPCFLRLEHYNIMQDPAKASYLAQIILNTHNPEETLSYYLKHPLTLQSPEFKDSDDIIPCAFDQSTLPSLSEHLFSDLPFDTLLQTSLNL